MVKKKIAFTKNVLTVTMATNLSTVINKSQYKNMLIIMPAAWSVADITFLISDNSTTGFFKLMIADNNLALKEAQIRAPIESMVISPIGKLKEALESAMFIKLRSGTSALPVDQNSARTFTIILSG